MSLGGSCSICPGGTYGNNAERLTCDQCPEGYYCPEGLCILSRGMFIISMILVFGNKILFIKNFLWYLLPFYTYSHLFTNCLPTYLRSLQLSLLHSPSVTSEIVTFPIFLPNYLSSTHPRSHLKLSLFLSFYPTISPTLTLGHIWNCHFSYLSTQLSLLHSLLPNYHHNTPLTNRYNCSQKIPMS